MKKAYLALAALISAAGLGNTVTFANGFGPGISGKVLTSESQPAQGNKSVAKDSKIARLLFGSSPSLRANVGKGYRASVKQHQRNASKARNTRRHRQTNKG